MFISPSFVNFFSNLSPSEMHGRITRLLTLYKNETAMHRRWEIDAEIDLLLRKIQKKENKSV